MTSPFLALLRQTDDTILVDRVAHRPGSEHASGARRPGRTSVGHAIAMQVSWCRDDGCYPHGMPKGALTCRR
jgi:hypothetical protein